MFRVRGHLQGRECTSTTLRSPKTFSGAKTTVVESAQRVILKVQSTRVAIEITFYVAFVVNCLRVLIQGSIFGRVGPVWSGVFAVVR